MAADFRKVSASNEATNSEAERIENNFRSAREKLKVAGLSDVLGEVLRQQRQTLPDQGKLGRRIKQLEEENAAITLQQIQHNTENRRLRNTDAYLAEYTEKLDADEAALLRVDLEELANSRRTLLDTAISLGKSRSRSLTELETGNRRLLKTTVDFDNFLDEKLLWIRSAPSMNLATIVAIPGQVADLLAPGHWHEVFKNLTARMTSSPLFMLLLALFAALLWKASHFRVLLQATGNDVGKPSLDRFSLTLKALGLTLLLALPWPLLTGDAGPGAGACAGNCTLQLGDVVGVA